MLLSRDATAKKLLVMNKITCFQLVMAGLLAGACHKVIINQQDLRNFEEVVLVANKAKYMPALVDSPLQNGWGLAWAPSGIAWVNANNDGLSALFTGEGAIVRAPINIPSPTDSVGGAPSGIVYSGGKGFVLADHQASNFLFVGEDGVLSGWNGADGNNAQRIKDRSATSSYKGLALDSVDGHNYIYAANFKTGKIDVWDTAFNPVSMSFHDPALPAHYAPFNIQPVGNWLFVTYAEQTSGSIDETDGPGKGFVDVFNPDGSFVHRFASRGSLNAPWGVAWAPAGWLSMADMGDSAEKGMNSGGGSGSFGIDGKHDITTPVVLVGNFGDGHINVFAPDGQFLGQLHAHNKVITIDGLWALQFPPATATSIDQSRLYFTAGPADEMDGMFGYLIKE